MHDLRGLGRVEDTPRWSLHPTLADHVHLATKRNHRHHASHLLEKLLATKNIIPSMPRDLTNRYDLGNATNACALRFATRLCQMPAVRSIRPPNRVGYRRSPAENRHETSALDFRCRRNLNRRGRRRRFRTSPTDLVVSGIQRRESTVSWLSRSVRRQ